MSPTLGPLHNWCFVKWRGSWRYPPRLWSRQLLVRHQRPCSASWSTRPQPTATFASGCICLVEHTGNGYGRLQTGSLPLKNELFTVSLPTVTELWQPPMYRISDCNDTKNWMLAQIEDQWICHLLSKPNHASGKTIANSPDTPEETYTKTEDLPPVKGKSSTNHPSFLGVLFLFSGHVFFCERIYYHLESLYAQPTNLLYFCETPSTRGMAATTNAPYKPASTTWLEGVLANSFVPPQHHWGVPQSIKVGSWEKP